MNILTTILVMLGIGLVYSLSMVLMNKFYFRRRMNNPDGDSCLSQGGCAGCGITGCASNPAGSDKAED